MFALKCDISLAPQNCRFQDLLFKRSPLSKCRQTFLVFRNQMIAQPKVDLVNFIEELLNNQMVCSRQSCCAAVLWCSAPGRGTFFGFGQCDIVVFAVVFETPLCSAVS